MYLPNLKDRPWETEFFKTYLNLYFCLILMIRQTWFLKIKSHFFSRSFLNFHNLHHSMLRPISNTNLKAKKKYVTPQHERIRVQSIYLHLIFAILQFEISSLMNYIFFLVWTLKWIFLPDVACKIKVWNWL